MLGGSSSGHECVCAYGNGAGAADSLKRSRSAASEFPLYGLIGFMTDVHDSNERFMTYWARSEPRVFAYIYTLVPNWADAQDILQDTSIVLWQKLDQFTPGTDFVRWACRVAFFEVKKYRQRSHLRGPLLSESFVDLLAKRMDDSAENLQILVAALGSCMEKLKVPERELIRVCYVMRVEVKSAATQLGRSCDDVYKSLQRVRRKLFDCICRTVRREEQT